MAGLMLSVFLAALDQVSFNYLYNQNRVEVRCLYNRRLLLQLRQLLSHNLEEGKTTVGLEGNQPSRSNFLLRLVSYLHSAYLLGAARHVLSQFQGNEPITVFY